MASLLILSIYRLFLFLIVFKQIFAGNSVCRTPSGLEGVCVGYRKCQFVLDLYERYNDQFPQFFIDYIFKSRCYPEEANVSIHLCCPWHQVIRDIVIEDEARKSVKPIEVSQSPQKKHRRLQMPSEDNWSKSYNNLDLAGVGILRLLRCGISNNNRIAGGNITLLNEYPWMALLRYSTLDNDFKCSGTLISKKFVLTAAHCVNNAAFPVIGVRLGEHDIDQKIDCEMFGRQRRCAPPVKDVEVDEVFIHPGYNLRSHMHDIALIRLKENVRFQVHIRPICLPISEESRDWNAEDDFIIAGWGRTELGDKSKVLLKALIRLYDVDVCRNNFRMKIEEEQIFCAGDLIDGRDSCKGDSGGPMFQLAPYIYDKRYIQYGVVSFGVTGCSTETKWPGVYTNVVTQMPWITRIIAEN